MFGSIFRSETEFDLYFALQNFPTYFFCYYMTRLGESSFEEILIHGTFFFVYCTIVITETFLTNDGPMNGTESGTRKSGSFLVSLSLSRPT